MLIKEIDRKLDMGLILRLRQNTELFISTRDMKEKLPVYIYGKGDQSWMSTYFSKRKENRSLELMINRFNPTEREDSYVVDTRINNVPDLEIIERLTDLPSFIISRSDLVIYSNNLLYF